MTVFSANGHLGQVRNFLESITLSIEVQYTNKSFIFLTFIAKHQPMKKFAFLHLFLHSATELFYVSYNT